MSLFGHKPTWLYESLPAVYAAAGVATAWIEHTPFGTAAGGGTVLLAGTLTVMRRRYRQKAHDSELASTPSALASPSRLAATARGLRDVATPTLGHPDLDRQHRQLAAMTAHVRTALAHGEPAADVELQLYELVDALAEHLRTEYQVYQRLGMKSPKGFSTFYRALRPSAETMFEDYKRAGLTLDQLVERLTTDLVAMHLKGDHPPLPSIEAALEKLRMH